MMLRYAALVILLVLVIGSGLLLKSKPSREQTTDRPDLSEGYYLLDATISDTNETGRQVYALNASRIDHLPADGSVRLTDLKLRYAGDPNAEEWTIEAASGAMRAERDRLDLQGGVTITSLDSESDRRTTISTERLTLDVRSNEARTNLPVSIEMDGGQLTAVGMNADLTNKTINLLAEVRGSFGAPP